MRIEVRFVGGALDGHRMELPDRERVCIGRHPDNDVVFDAQHDLSVSSHHAELRREADGYYLYDLGSSNGTFLGQGRITRLRIASGQEVVFGQGGPRLQFRFVDDAPTLPTGDTPSPGGEPSAAARLEAGGKVGARTVAMMIDSALDKARSSGGGGMGKSTVFVRSMVNQAVRKSTSKFKVLTVVLVVLLAASVTGFLVLRHFERQEASRFQDELQRKMARLMQRQGTASAGEKVRLAAKLERLNRQLADGRPAAVGKQIVKRNERAVFLMSYNHPTAGAKGFCTAFAVRKRVVGTNAHCVLALERYRGKGYRVFVVMNRHPGRRFEIVRVAHHPRYHKPRRTISQDVGLLELDGDLPVRVELASTAELHDLGPGDTMFMYGFPGRLATVSSPDATLVQGVVGRVTRLDGRMGSASQNLLVQHSAFTSGGTSGSPIFNNAGKVVAVNTGGYVEPGSLQIMDPSTGRAGKVVVAKQLPGYNFGIRVDALNQLLADLGG